MEYTEQKRLYDAACKKVLAEKGIIANILKYCTTEFADVSIADICNKYLQEKPIIGNITVEPADITSLQGTANEDNSLAEGKIYYDIRFTAIVPNDKDIVELIINIEAQNNFNPGYPLLKRSIYYGSRLISGQYGSVFTKSHYEKIQKVYSIWICTEPTKSWEYSITKYSMQESNIVGIAHAPVADYDLMTIVFVCLGHKSYTELTGLLKILNLMFIDRIADKNSLSVLKDEFAVSLTPSLEKGVKEMCNLSEGVEKRGIEKGQRDSLLSVALEMLRDKMPLKLIEKYSRLSAAEIRKLAKDNGISIV